MRLLFDQNISFRIIKLIQDHFSDCGQVRQLSLENRTDREIWNFARDNNYTIVTFDSDFNELSTLLGPPPKVIWLRLGNTSTKYLSDFIIQRREIIHDFINDSKYKEIGCLEFDL